MSDNRASNLMENFFPDEGSEPANVNRDWINNQKPFFEKPHNQIMDKKTSSGFSIHHKENNKKKFNYQDALKDPKKRKIIVYVIQTAFALLVFVIVVILLLAANPALTQKRTKDGWASGKQSPVWVSITALLSAVVMFSICEFMRYFNFPTQ